MKSIIARLEALEAKHAPKIMTVITLIDGMETEVTARQCIEQRLPFVRVCCGFNDRDFDGLIALMRDEAFFWR